MRFSVLRAVALVAVGALMSGGGAYAASRITGAQVQNGSLTGRDIRDHSLTRRDFRGVLRGPAGPQGERGPAGTATAASVAVKRVSAQRTIDAGTISKASVACPFGTQVTGGGYRVDGDGRVTYSYDADGTGRSWSVGVDNASSDTATIATVVAFCAS